MKSKQEKFERQCVGCGNHFPREQLIRITYTQHDNTRRIVLNSLDDKVAGRSIYVYKSPECLERLKANSKKAFRRLVKKSANSELGRQFNELIENSSQFTFDNIECKGEVA